MYIYIIYVYIYIYIYIYICLTLLFYSQVYSNDIRASLSLNSLIVGWILNHTQFVYSILTLHVENKYIN